MGLTMVWETNPTQVTSLMLTLTELLRGVASWSANFPGWVASRGSGWQMGFLVERVNDADGRIFILLTLTWRPGRPGDSE